MKGEEEKTKEKKCPSSVTTLYQIQESNCSQQKKGEVQPKDRRP